MSQAALVVRQVVAEPPDVERITQRVAHELIERHQGARGLVLIGIRTGGYVWAQRLAQALAAADRDLGGIAPPVGALDIALYRDDIASRIVPEIGPTELPVPIGGARVVLVDDVLFTGRTVRAALDALVDYGRPRWVKLAVLVDRGHRELPIGADHIGVQVATDARDRVRVDFADGGARILHLAPGGAP